ncbi:MAG: hypothetical protein KatS3mg121_0426 [Gammaproteobacteria bacterium]|nr:MAG: hypothetical protein KatS3mg121_0426 [Gammaproteobacteria bacterium]
MRRLIALALVAALAGAGCSDNRRYETAVCALVDVSGTYADQVGEVLRIVKAGIVPQLRPGDSLFVITVDSNSYNEDDLVAALRLDYVPSKANDQKLAFAQRLDAFAAAVRRARYTDLTGAMLLCRDHLEDSGAGRRVMLVFSDMKEEIQPGLKRELPPGSLAGVHVAALNVIKLDADSADPARYRARLDRWAERLAAAGAASWTVLLDAVKIPEYLRGLEH